MADTTYMPAVYRKQGGAELVVASGGAITVESGGYIDHDDSGGLRFGTGNDITMKFDGTTLIFDTGTDDILWEIGDSAATQKSLDVKWYANEANGASYLYCDASANLVYTTGVDLQIKDDDFLVFGSGAGAAGDVQIEWDTGATPDVLVMTASADDTVFQIGNGTASFDVKTFGNTANDYMLWDASANVLSFVGAVCIDFDSATCNGSDTDGLLIKGGSSSTPVTEDTASSRFISLYTDCGATSGSSYGYRHSHYITGAGGSGAAMRGFTNVKGVTAATAYGGEFTAEIDDTASSAISGEAAGLRSVMSVQSAASGTLGAINLVYDVNTGLDATAVASAFINVGNIGAGTGCNNFFNIQVAKGTNSATALTTSNHDEATCDTYIRGLINGTPHWIAATTHAPAAA